MTDSVERIHRFARLASTQDEAHRLAAAGAPSGTVVVAAEQEAGRGARGRKWASPVGGLWMTLVWRPPAPAAAAGPASAAGVELLSLRVGFAVAEALNGFPGIPRVMLKWPNDLMLDDRKLGGVLCEARWQGEGLGWVAIGLGLNVQNPLPTDARVKPARLAEWRADLSPDDVLRPILAQLERMAEAATLTAYERAAFAGRDWLRGRALAEPACGIADGIGQDGSLRIRGADGTVVSVRSGDATPLVEVAGGSPPTAVSP